tara:strand:- start:140 stop:301 length:162 start_codon:yes stop_codon:yes gene_type:complete
MSNILNIKQEVQDYIDTLADNDKITTAISFATQNRDCTADVVQQVVEKQHGHD